MLDILQDAAGRACRYLESLPHRSVAPRPDALAALSALDEPLSEGGTPAASTLELLDRLVSPATMATACPRFFGFVIGGSRPEALAARWLASAWDQNAALAAPTPGVARLEEIALRWLIDVLRLPEGTAAGFVTGATVANFTALAAARHSVLARHGWNVEANGLFRAQRSP